MIYGIPNLRLVTASGTTDETASTYANRSSHPQIIGQLTTYRKIILCVGLNMASGQRACEGSVPTNQGRPFLGISGSAACRRRGMYARHHPKYPFVGVPVDAAALVHGEPTSDSERRGDTIARGVLAAP